MGDAIDPFHLANGFEAVIGPGYECQERSPNRGPREVWTLELLFRVPRKAPKAAVTNGGIWVQFFAFFLVGESLEYHSEKFPP